MGRLGYPFALLSGGEWGLVAPAVFKTVVSARKRRKVGSIPTRLRQGTVRRSAAKPAAARTDAAAPQASARVHISARSEISIRSPLARDARCPTADIDDAAIHPHHHPGHSSSNRVPRNSSQIPRHELLQFSRIALSVLVEPINRLPHDEQVVLQRGLAARRAAVPRAVVAACEREEEERKSPAKTAHILLTNARI